MCHCVCIDYYRMGAPFFDKFLILRSRLEDAGLIKTWTEIIMADRVRSNREKLKDDSNTVQYASVQVRTVRGVQQRFSECHTFYALPSPLLLRFVVKAFTLKSQVDHNTRQRLKTLHSKRPQ